MRRELKLRGQPAEWSFVLYKRRPAATNEPLWVNLLCSDEHTHTGIYTYIHTHTDIWVICPLHALQAQTLSGRYSQSRVRDGNRKRRVRVSLFVARESGVLIKGALQLLMNRYG